MNLQSITFPGLEDAYQIPAPLDPSKFAPSGYGYGEGLVGLGNANDDAAFTAALSKQFALTANKTRQFYFTYGGGAFLGKLWNAGNNYGVLVATSYAEPNVGYRFKQMVRVCTNGTWREWVDNSPTAFAPASHTHEKMKLLWENASPTSSFDTQTVSLALSDYSQVLVYFRVYNGSGTYSEETFGAHGLVGNWCMAVCNSESGSTPAQRAFQITTTGIAFSKAYYAASFGGALTWSSNLLIPTKIYGIKEVS